MNAFERLLSTTGGSHHIGSRPGRRVLTTALTDAGWKVRVVDGRRCTTKAELLRTLATELTFPEWFGHNWDALVDCLRDRAVATPGLALLITQARATPPDDCLAVLADIVNDLHAEGHELLLVTRG